MSEPRRSAHRDYSVTIQIPRRPIRGVGSYASALVGRYTSFSREHKTCKPQAQPRSCYIGAYRGLESRCY